MRLSRAEIQNFRSIESLKFVFQPSCRVLVGINESGKSNILRALSLLDPDVEITGDDLREIRPNEKPYEKAYVHFIFTLSQEDKARGLKSLTKKIAGDLKTKPIIQIGKTRMSVAEFVTTRTAIIYKVDLLKPSRTWTYFGLPETARLLGPWKWVSSKSAALAANAELAQFQIVDPDDSNVEGAELVDFCPDDLNHLVARQLHDLLQGELPTVIFWRYDENQLLPGKIEISEFTADPDTCIPLKHMFQLAGHSDIAADIEQALERSNGMRNLLKRVSRISTRHLHHVWKEYRDIDFELVQNGDRIDAHVLDRYDPNSLVHGILFAKEQIKISRVLTTIPTICPAEVTASSDSSLSCFTFR